MTQPTTAERLADMIDTIERQGDAMVRLAPDMRRLLVQASILARRLAIDSRDRHAARNDGDNVSGSGPGARDAATAPGPNSQTPIE